MTMLNFRIYKAHTKQDYTYYIVTAIQMRSFRTNLMRLLYLKDE